MQFKAIYQGQRQSGRSKSQAAKFVLEVATNGNYMRWNESYRMKYIARLINQFELGGE